jgi:putative ABC transport system ATP-binding protein
MPEAPLIRLSGVTKHYGSGDTRVEALKGIDFELRPGSVAALAGKSGSGKSTLLNVIGCILAPNDGRMEIDGETVADGDGWLRRDYRHLRLRKIGFIFQFHNLIPFLNSVQNIELVMKLAGMGRREARKRAMELLDYLGVAHRWNRLPASLSGGEAQRVAIARALANSPRIVLADEPTASLDSARTLAVVDLLRQLAREQGAGVLIVTHDEQVVVRCDQIYQMSNGTIEGGSADDMYFSKFRRLRQRPDAAQQQPAPEPA